MGAPREVIQATLESHAVYQRKAFSSPGDITDANWTEHYGDEKCVALPSAETACRLTSPSYYQAYVNFFAEKVLKDGIAPTVVKYVFDMKSNGVDGLEDKKQPQMLNRLLSGALHPYIHVGYGLEFDFTGMAVEGIEKFSSI